MKAITSIIFFLALFIPALAQNAFEIDDNKNHFQLPFQLLHDLVIVPVEINGVELSFLLDTGVDSTILFNLMEVDSLEVKNATSILLKGLGGGDPIQAIKSTGNEVRIGKSTSQSLILYVVYDNEINLSNRVGVPIHGIIGNDFFKDFILEFNYLRQKIKIFKPEFYKYKKCRKCEDLPLTFFMNKPYVTARVKIDDNTELPLNFLIDSGLGDAVWIMSDENQGIKVPERNFEDFLGLGMSGSVYGLRSRIKSLKLGRFEFEEVTASFPDSLYVKEMQTYKLRNGTIGAQILKRFDLTIDYPNKKIRLSANRNFNDPFEYDMSGVIIAHTGFSYVKKLRSGIVPKDNNRENNDPGILVYKSTSEIEFTLEPQYGIVEIRPNSPAEKAGLQIGDLLIDINGRKAYRFKLSEINSILSSEEGKRIRFRIMRNGIEKVITFELKKIL
ncbi:MAG: aspartyl protease family protein [Gillisia sp.]|nr:aspartyl protease family protein [Gillisia sp.]